MIRRAGEQDLPALARLAAKVFDGAGEAELTEEFSGLLNNPRAALFVAELDGQPVGFAQAQLRQDYVEGSDFSPVGYLEGLYVEPAHRGHGLGRQLVRACEGWAREHDCSQFASDTQLRNTDSLAFHLAAGFREVGRIICFIKDL